MHPDRVGHIPVLRRETLAYLNPRPGQVLVDCTLGAGGHSRSILETCSSLARLIGIDRDRDVLEQVRSELYDFEGFHPVWDDFQNLCGILDRLGVEKVDGMLADLGVSSMQLSRPERGFSFQQEGPLDMRMNQRQGEPAWQLVRRMPLAELQEQLYQNGEKRFARRIARTLKQMPIEDLKNTLCVAKAIQRVIPGGRGRIHPATRTFQAIRRMVNREHGALASLLQQMPNVLAVHGRAVLISFHSLEDRQVKHAFRDLARTGAYRLLTPRPIRPAPDEVHRNPGARSACLRAIEKAA